MAVTKILARNGGLKEAIEYVLNGDKTDEQILTAHLNCDPGHAYQQMMDTKRDMGQLNGRQCYHIIQSFTPGEITPELALEIATEFAKEHLKGYQVVIGTHTDRHHIHNHILFNSVNDETGEKYHCSNADYYKQIRAISDRLCREHGLSIIMQGENSKALSYIEWLCQSRGQPTYRAMLEADMKIAIGDFYMLMEGMGYEIKYGNRLGFKLRGQEHFMYLERKDKRYSENGIRAAIDGSLDAIAMRTAPAYVIRPEYKLYKKHPKYKGVLALYIHYLYVLGKIQKQQYPPRMTGQMKAAVMKFERYREQFKFLNENHITTEAELQKFHAELQTKLATLTKQRTVLNVQKKRKRKLFDALADMEALAPAKRLNDEGMSGLEEETQKYIEADKLLVNCDIPREKLAQQKADIYTQLADLNLEIRQTRKQIKMCQEIQEQTPQMEKDIQRIEAPQKNQQQSYGQER